MNRFLFALLAVAFPAAAADPPAAGGWEIHIEFTAIIMPEKLALSLLGDLHDPAKIDAAFAQIEASIARGEGTLAGRHIANTTSGKSSEARSTEEIRYGIEWEQPSYPALGSTKDVSSLPAELERVDFPPTAFETRDAGTALEVQDARVSPDGKAVRVTANVKHVRLLKWDEFESGITPKGARIAVKQPRFFTAHNSIESVLPAGARVLAGSHIFPDQPKTWELFFVKAWTTRRAEVPR